MIGDEFPESLVNLVHLKHLSVFNADYEYEREPNKNANNIGRMPKVLEPLQMLEEINLAFLSMNRTITLDLTTLSRLRFLNLSNN